MGRAKVRMELITNEKTRRLTGKSRKKGLKKKLEELSTLCDVKVGMIMYEPPKDGMPPAEPEVWPNDPNQIKELYDMYKAQAYDDRQKRTSDLSSFFKDRNDKLEAELMKQRRKNNEAKYPTWDPRFDDLSEAQLRELARLLETKIEAANSRMELLKECRKMESSIPMGATYFYSTEFFQSLLSDNNNMEPGLHQLQLTLPQPPRPEVISEPKNFEMIRGVLEAPPLINADYTDPIMSTLRSSSSSRQINYDEVQLDGMDISNMRCMPLINHEPMYYDTFPTPLNIIMPNHHEHDGGRTEVDFSYNSTAMQQLYLPEYAHQYYFPTYGGDSDASADQMHSFPADDYYYETGHFIEKDRS